MLFLLTSVSSSQYVIMIIVTDKLLITKSHGMGENSYVGLVTDSLGTKPLYVKKMNKANSLKTFWGHHFLDVLQPIFSMRLGITRVLQDILSIKFNSLRITYWIRILIDVVYCNKARFYEVSMTAWHYA